MLELNDIAHSVGAFEGSTYDRKIREIIQSIRLTQEFSGLEGKRQIMIDYLNQNYYGDQSYGVAAAALDYFGVTSNPIFGKHDMAGRLGR